MVVAMRPVPVWRAITLGALVLVAGVFAANQSARTAAFECRRHLDGGGTCVLRTTTLLSTESQMFALAEVRGTWIERHHDKNGDTFELLLSTDRGEHPITRSRRRSILEVDAGAIDAYLREARPVAYRAAWGTPGAGRGLLAGAIALAAFVVVALTATIDLRLESVGRRLRVRRRRFGRERTLLDAPLDGVLGVAVERHGSFQRLVLRTRLGEAIPICAGFTRAPQEERAAEIEAFLTDAS